MPQRRQPVQKRSQDTLDRIVQAARELFSSQGLHRISSHQIAQAAGISVGTFYLYFPDKNALFVQLLQQRFEEFRELHTKLKLGEIQDLHQRLAQLWQSLVVWARSWDRFFLDVSALYYADADVRTEIDTVETAFALELAQLFSPWLETLDPMQQQAKAMFIYNLLESTLRTILLTDAEEAEMLGKELLDCLSAYLGPAG